MAAVIVDETQEQEVLEAILAEIASKKGDSQALDQYETLFLAMRARQNDSPESFAAFFRLMHGTPLHSEGETWIKNAYKAHDELGLGLAQECHRESGKTTVFSKFFF